MNDEQKQAGRRISTLRSGLQAAAEALRGLGADYAVSAEYDVAVEDALLDVQTALKRDERIRDDASAN